jgi:transposase, IS30 family
MAARRIRGVRLTREERLEVRRLIENGRSFEQAAVAVRCSTKTIQRVVDSVGGMPARGRTCAKLRLSIAEREEISLGLGGEESYRAIGRRLGRAPSTISREVNGNGGRRRYRAVRADEAVYKNAERPKVAMLRRCRRLRMTCLGIFGPFDI